MDILWDRGHKDILLSGLENSNIDRIQRNLPNLDRLLNYDWHLNTLLQSYHTLDFQIVAHVAFITEYISSFSYLCCFKLNDYENWVEYKKRIFQSCICLSLQMKQHLVQSRNMFNSSFFPNNCQMKFQAMLVCAGIRPAIWEVLAIFNNCFSVRHLISEDLWTTTVFFIPLGMCNRSDMPQLPWQWRFKWTTHVKSDCFG